MKFEKTQVPHTACRPSAIRLRDQDDPHDDAHPEGENSAKRQKTSEHGMFVFRESSSGQDYESEPGLSTSGNQDQSDDFDFWTNSYATDDDVLSNEKVSQELVDEMSQTIDEAKLRKVVNEMKEIIVPPYQPKPTPVVQSCQRDLKAPALSLVNQDLLHLKKGNTGPEKIALSLHKLQESQLGVESYQLQVNLTAPTITFPDIEKYKVFSNVSKPLYGIIYKNNKKEKRVMRHQEVHTFCDATLKRVLEGLKSYNNDVKYGYVTHNLSKEDVEYLQLFAEEIEERLKYHDQVRRWEMYVNERPLGSRWERPKYRPLGEDC
ncbi:hypothetical protein Tco_1414816 [Tanacetum coccineum]